MTAVIYARYSSEEREASLKGSCALQGLRQDG